MKTKHTPTPWRVQDRLNCLVIWAKPTFFGASQMPITQKVCELPCDRKSHEDEIKVNAAFIVRAVNAHDALVEALEDITAVAVSRGVDLDWPNPDQGPVFDAVRAALKLAKGEEV